MSEDVGNNERSQGNDLERVVPRSHGLVSSRATPLVSILVLLSAGLVGWFYSVNERESPLDRSIPPLAGTRSGPGIAGQLPRPLDSGTPVQDVQTTARPAEDRTAERASRVEECLHGSDLAASLPQRSESDIHARQAADTPLLQPGKKTLFQRVLTRPGARLVKSPGRVGSVEGRIVNTFSQTYVYERRPEDGQDWLRVAVDPKGTGQGWIAEKETVPWKQQLILVMTNRGSVRDRLSFFDSRASLEGVLRAPDPSATNRQLIGSFGSGAQDRRIVALEPETYVDIHQHFYLLPILEHVETILPSGDHVRLLRVASIAGEGSARVPILFDAWISDRDLADPTKETVEVRVLLTRNQLSDLQMIIQRIVYAADHGMLKPEQFFDTLRSIAAQFVRDPSLARTENATRLADLGLLDEYLSDLPYHSKVLSLSQDTWTRWGPEKQLDFTNDIKRKLRKYASYNEDLLGWFNPAQTADVTGDFVYPVPLTDMP